MIVVTAPTGNIGSRVLAEVADGARPVRAIVRDPAKLPADLRERVEVHAGSHSDPDVLARAFDGADTVFWLVPPDRQAPSPDEAYSGFARPAVEAIRTHGVRRVVSISALGRGTASAARAGHVTATLAMDDLIAATGVAFRAVACPTFMDNLLRQTSAIKHQGAFYDVLPPDYAAPTACTRDIAGVASRLLLDPLWTGRDEVPVLGPEDLSPDQEAEIMSEVLGISVKYQQIPVSALGAQVLANGLSEAMAQSMMDMATAKLNHLDEGVVRTPHHATETPTTFRQWCEEVLKPEVAKS
ncbi:NmrA family transcriptional regulator [Amycolatopsis sp. AA4]|uniref:NAD(P)H-binding protein n=1 Tax=Actinomycetes TaxID=1760 RepID=UPI0001B58AF2|nr:MULTISPECIES: NAD(P)H-binding protein [Actinomycetes]ATY11423.1 NmrA family transcriptional regulator [Amycolatopsis sp. AA4]EFL07047.1 NmrA family protein [Streptomyces sp. AA4]